MDPFTILLQSIQSIAIILILAGMLIAFLWKLAFYINLFVGLIITIALTYALYSITKDVGAAGIIFIVCLIVSGIIAALGGLLCLLEGFTFTALGIWGYFVSGSPGSVFSSGTVVVSAVASIFLTVIAAFFGGQVFSTRALGAGRKNRKLFRNNRQYPTYQQTPGVKKVMPIEVEVLPEKASDAGAGSYPKQAVIVNRQEFLVRKDQINKQLENLKKETLKGKINEGTSKNLREELERKLDAIDKELAEKLKEEIEDLKREFSEIETEIIKSRDRISALESEKGTNLKQQEELGARFRIKQITKGEYKEREKELAQKNNQINLNITQNNERNQNLIERKKTINQILNSERAGLNQ